MRTRFVIHKNLLSPVFKVRKRPVILNKFGLPQYFYPEDIVVVNPRRAHEKGYFVLPKSEYVPCDSHGVVKDKHVETTFLANGGSEQASGTEAD